MGMNGVYPEYAPPWLVRCNATWGEGGVEEGKGGGEGGGCVVSPKVRYLGG